MTEVEELAAQLRESTTPLRQNPTSLMPSFESVWNKIGLIANKEYLSRQQFTDMLALSAASIAQTSVGTVGAVGKTGFYLLDEGILNDYRDALVGAKVTALCAICNKIGCHLYKLLSRISISKRKLDLKFGSDTVWTNY